jgi:hypothetical protein
MVTAVKTNSTKTSKIWKEMETGDVFLSIRPKKHDVVSWKSLRDAPTHSSSHNLETEGQTRSAAIILLYN